MKAGIASLDTIRPLNRPRTIPASMPTAMLAGRSIPATIRMPLIIGQNASRPARERSIPLMTMTNVIPTAQMPVIDDCLTTLSRFDRSRKRGTCEPNARKAAMGRRRNSPRRAAGWRFTSSERPLASFSQVALVVDHSAGVDHLGDAVGGLLSSEHGHQVFNRDWTHLARKLSHGTHNGALFYEVHRLLGPVDRQDLDASAVGVASGLEDAVQHHVGSAEQTVHVLVGLEHVLRHLHGHRIGPIAGLLAYYNKAAALDAGLEAVDPQVAGQTAIGATHDQNVALAAQFLDHTLAGRLAGIEVVGANVGDVQALVAFLHRGVHHNNRDFGHLSLLQDRHHRLAVHGAENDGVDLLSDKVLHLIHLDGDTGLLTGGDQEKLVTGLLDRILDGSGDGFLEV